MEYLELNDATIDNFLYNKGLSLSDLQRKGELIGFSFTQHEPFTPYEPECSIAFSDDEQKTKFMMKYL